MGRDVRDARVLHSLGSIGFILGEGLERSMASVPFSVFRLCVPQFTLCPRGQSREMSVIGFRNIFPLIFLPY